MKITFIGAAHEVTGSCTLLENGGKYYLVDKGMEQGVDMFENVPLPVAPEEIRSRPRLRHIRHLQSVQHHAAGLRPHPGIGGGMA